MNFNWKITTTIQTDRKISIHFGPMLISWDMFVLTHEIVQSVFRELRDPLYDYLGKLNVLLEIKVGFK